MPNALRYLLLPVLHALGPVLVGYGLTMLIPYLVSVAQADGADAAFLTAFAVTTGTGALLTLATRGYSQELTARHGFLLVTLTWTAVPLFATIPLLLELPQYTFSAAYFEMMSCLTTTGATMMTGLDDLPLSINGLRCFLSWLGGMGLIVLSVAILPLLGVGGAQILKAETSGPLKESKLTPRIADTAQALYIIYFGISVVLTVAFHFAGMSWDDAVLHMMTTVSLSGIGAHDSSFAYFESNAVDLVTVVFMIVCGCNFSLHFAAWHKRDLRLYWRDPEVLGWVGVVSVLTLFTTLLLIDIGYYEDDFTAFVKAAFAVVSVASTTGFASDDYALWPTIIPLVMLLSSIFATCAGSTGGGIKMIRLLILIKQTKREFLLLLHPKASFPLTVGETRLNDQVASAVLAYLLLWVISVGAGVLLLVFSGMPMLESFSATIACINNLGQAMGALGPAGNYAGLTTLQFWICTFLMLIGRLELFTVFILFTKGFWRG